MSKKYNLYSFLFEDAPISNPKAPNVSASNPKPPNRPDLKARLRQKEKENSEWSANPKPGVRNPVGEFHPQQILSGMQRELNKRIPSLEKISKELNPSEKEIKDAKEATGEIENYIDSIAHMQGYKAIGDKDDPKKSDPSLKSQISGTQPSSKSNGSVNPTAKTEPAISLPKTQQVQQTDIQNVMNQRASQQAYPSQSVQPQPATPTTNRQGFFSNIKQRFGLKEAVKQIIKERL